MILLSKCSENINNDIVRDQELKHDFNLEMHLKSKPKVLLVVMNEYKHTNTIEII